MSLAGREDHAGASEDLAEVLKAIDTIRSLQTGQREIADAVKRLSDRVQALEVEFRAQKGEIRADMLRETQATVFATQDSFYRRLQDIAVEVALLRREKRGKLKHSAERRKPSTPRSVSDARDPAP